MPKATATNHQQTAVATAPTILDVARKAAVSAGTVSRVLNGHPAVSPANQRQVLEAVRELNYRPKQKKISAAKANPLDRKNVLLLLLGMDQSLARLPVVATALHGVEAALAEARANVLFANLPLADRVPEPIREGRVDAVVIKGALQGDLIGAANPQLVAALEALPSVWVLGRPEGAQGDVVQVSDSRVGQMAAEYLVARGHKRLAFVSAKPTQATLMRRQASFVFHAQRAGARVESFLGASDEWRFPSHAVDQVEMVQELIDELLARRNRPTAVFAPDDSLGAMIYRALARRGLQVGRELSLISCNNETPLLCGLFPTPTTIDIHAEKIGWRAVDQLSWRLLHRDWPGTEIGIEPSLVAGESVATL